MGMDMLYWKKMSFLALGALQGVGLLFVYLIMNVILYAKLRAFLAKKRRTLGSLHYRTVEQKETKSTVRIMCLALNCLVGYFPNKLANNSLLYVLSAADFSLYIPFSNMLIWVSHSLKLFINLAFDYEFRRVFWATFRRLTSSQRQHIITQI